MSEMLNRRADDRAEEYTGPRLFGAPVGDFGVFQTLLFTLAASVAAFFLATFLSIMGMLAYTTLSHQAVDFSLAYRRVGLPVGLVMLAVAGLYMGSLLIRRLTSRR